MRRYRRYPTELKLSVVADYLEDRFTLRGLARKYGIGRNLILLWAERYDPGRLADKRARRKLLADYERKIAELESTVTTLEQELESVKNPGPNIAPP